MINAEFLAGCSDEQINKGVAWLEVNNGFGFGQMCQLQYFACNAYLTDIRSYCTNPNDIMPIAIANKFSITPVFSKSDNYRVRDSSCFIYTFNPNPYRAICEVYILMSVNK